MGRPKLYKTLEERVLAARHYRATYHAKNRAAINQKLVTKRELLKSAQVRAVNGPVQLMGQPSASATLSRRAGHPREKNTSTMARSTVHNTDSELAVVQALKDLVGTSSRQWIDGICKAYISSGDYQEILKVLSAVEALSERLCKLTSRHWCSYGGDRAQESTLSKSLRSIIKGLEDLCLNAMEENDVSGLADNGLLLYQAAPDILL